MTRHVQACAHTYTLTVSHFSSLFSNVLARSNTGILPWAGFLKLKSMAPRTHRPLCRQVQRQQPNPEHASANAGHAANLPSLSTPQKDEELHVRAAVLPLSTGHTKTLSSTFRHHLRFCASSLWPDVSWAENEPSASEPSSGSSVRDEFRPHLDPRLNSHQNER